MKVVWGIVAAVGFWLLNAALELTTYQLDTPETVAVAAVGLALAVVGWRLSQRRPGDPPQPPAAPPAPSLRVEPVVVRKNFQGLGGLRTHAAWTADVAQVEVSVTSAAVTVRPSITYTDRDNRVLRLDGRWADTPLPEHPDRAVLATTIIRGERRPLDIALGLGDGLCYALDNRAPFHAYRVPGYELALPAVVEVEFPGATPERVVFTLREQDGRLVLDFAFRPDDQD